MVASLKEWLPSEARGGLRSLHSMVASLKEWLPSEARGGLRSLHSMVASLKEWLPLETRGGLRSLHSLGTSPNFILNLILLTVSLKKTTSVSVENTPCSGRHGGGPFRASIFSLKKGGGGLSAAGAMGVIEIL